MSQDPPAVRYGRNIQQRITDALPWINQHLLLISIGLLAVTILWRLRGVRRHKRLKTSAPGRMLADKIALLVGHQHGTTGFVKWPRNAQATGSIIEIRTHRYWNAPRKLADMPDIIASIAGGTWVLDRHDGLHDRLYYRRLPLPGMLPDYYEYDRDGRWPIHRVPFAIDPDGRPVIGDLSSQAPHVLIGGGTGKGKTSTLTVFIAHVTARGGLVDIIDPKYIGYTEAFEGLPNVRVHVDLADAVAAVEEFHADMSERYQLKRGRADLTDSDRFPTRLLVIDEMGSFTSMIREDWLDVRDKTDPPSSPTERRLQLILWQGRAADMHLVIAAQQANAQVIGSTDKREQFAMRIGCGAPGKRGGPLLFGTDDLPPVDPTVKGRGLACLEGDDVRAVQLAHISEDDARRVAARGGLSFARFEQLRGVNTAVNNAVNMPVHAQNLDVDTPHDGSVNSSQPPHVAGAAARAVTCSRCSHEFTTRSQSVARCSGCGHRQRVGQSSL